MTYEEVKNLQISNIISHTSDLLNLTKNCLSIVSTSTAKDDELCMLIGAGVSDLIRNDIDVLNNISDELIQATIVMYVKANFEMLDEATRKRALQMYIMNCKNLSLSNKYLISEETDVPNSL